MKSGLEVVRPQGAILVTFAVSRGVEEYDVTDDDFRPQLLNIRNLTLEVVESIRNRPADILQHGLEGHQEPELSSKFVGEVPVLHSGQTGDLQLPAGSTYYVR